MITGPPTPDWSICVRRKISARISRSPKLGFGDQQSPHPVGRKDQRLDGLGNYAVAERRPASKLRQFANERAGAECVKVLASAVGVVAVNVNLAAENDGEA
jgi:hypothetical protein